MNAQKVRIFLFQCKDLPAADETGTSDIFLKVWNSDANEIKTHVVEENTSPIFMKALEFFIDFDDLDDAPPIIIEAYD